MLRTVTSTTILLRQEAKTYQLYITHTLIALLGGVKWTATKTIFGVDTMSCDALQHVASTTEEEVTMF